MINTTNIEKAKQEIKISNSPKIVKAQDEKFNRSILEYGKFDILLLSLTNGKDNPKQLDTGINHFLANQAKKRNIALGIDLAEIRNLQIIEKSKVLARLSSLIETCKKEGARIFLTSIKSKQGTINLLQSLGASSQQAAQALSF